MVVAVVVFLRGIGMGEVTKKYLYKSYLGCPVGS